jgi:hypothetical protein
VVLPLTLIGAGALVSWQLVWREAEAEMARTADAATEYAQRVLDGHRLRAEQVNLLLRGLTDAEIRAREAALHEELRSGRSCRRRCG